MITFCPDPVPQVRKEKKPAGNSVRKVISDAGKEQTLDNILTLASHELLVENNF